MTLNEIREAQKEKRHMFSDLSVNIHIGVTAVTMKVKRDHCCGRGARETE